MFNYFIINITISYLTEFVKYFLPDLHFKIEVTTLQKLHSKSTHTAINAKKHETKALFPSYPFRQN